MDKTMNSNVEILEGIVKGMESGMFTTFEDYLHSEDRRNEALTALSDFAAGR